MDKVLYVPVVNHLEELAKAVDSQGRPFWSNNSAMQQEMLDKAGQKAAEAYSAARRQGKNPELIVIDNYDVACLALDNYGYLGRRIRQVADTMGFQITTRWLWSGGNLEGRIEQLAMAGLTLDDCSEVSRQSKDLVGYQIKS